MILPPFRVHRPETLEEALSLAVEHCGDFDFLAGGTDLLPNYKNRLRPRGHLVSLDRVGELRGIETDRLGAMERLSHVAEAPEMLRSWPGLGEAIGVVASPLVRNSATLGGNLLVENRCYWFNQTAPWRASIGSCLKAESDTCRVIPQQETCYALYPGDLAPVLMVLDASVELASPRGFRTVALREFYRGDGIGRNVKEPDEIIVSIRRPEAAARLRVGYRKLRHRDTLDFPEMGVAAALRLDSAGRVESLCVADTAVDTVPQFVDHSEALAGRPPSEAIGGVAADLSKRARPRKNSAMPVGYRKRMVAVYLRRLLEDLSAERAVAPD